MTWQAASGKPYALVRGGAGIVMLSRLSPLFPFAMTSFAYGACAVSTWDFLLGTAVGQGLKLVHFFPST
jgi:uncharacterized membrane protein YdjX (TVP38/TMEM64 family)